MIYSVPLNLGRAGVIWLEVDRDGRQEVPRVPWAARYSSCRRGRIPGASQDALGISLAAQAMYSNDTPQLFRARLRPTQTKPHFPLKLTQNWSGV